MHQANRPAAWAAAAILAIGFGGARSASARDFEFNLVPSYTSSSLGLPTAGDSEWVDIGDANNDGRDDLSVIVWDPVPAMIPTGWIPLRRAVVRLQNEDGTLGAPIILSAPNQSMNTVEAVDLDGNGERELVVGYDGGLLVYRWNGTEFVPTAVPALVDCRDMAIGDIDGNGTRDVFCSAREAQYGAIYLVAPDGTVGDPGYLQTNTSKPPPANYAASRQFKLDDVTGDGRADLIQSDFGLWSFMVYANDGAGGFLPPRAYAYPSDYYTGFNGNGIETFDVDGDGTREIVVARSCNRPCSALLVYRRDANGYFRLAQSIPTYDIPSTLEKYDVDGDGYLDLMVGHRGWSSIGRYMGGPSGMSQAEILTAALQTSFLWFFLDFGDLNGDGRTDLAIPNAVADVELKYGMGKRANDVNRNFMSDLVWRDTTGGRATVWPESRGDIAQAMPTVAAPWAIKAVADFDGDDKADVFWRNPSNGANMIWIGGNASTTMATVPLAAEWQLAGSGDFDGDRRNDVLWRNAKTGENMVWLGGHNDRAAALYTVQDQRWQVVGVGDFDGDRVDDILWRHSGNGSNTVWFSANVATSVAITPVANLAWKVVGVGDFNRDGMDDIAWRNAQTGANTIWRSASAARQQAVASVSNTAWKIVAVGDYDGDGFDDFMWRNSTGANLLWFKGDASKQRPLVNAGSAWQVVP
jgi:hypothetical protein